ncbi:MAG: hypothetical protein IPO92_23460 [Saprospiraceae bacterium]|nr:hypothetical protein [Saprospiraceae bacterium]
MSLQLKGPEDFRTLQDMTWKRGIESLLRAEMNEHLGYPTGDKPLEGNLREWIFPKDNKTSVGDQVISILAIGMGNLNPS